MRILVIRHGARGRPRDDLPRAAARDDPLFTDLPDTIPAFPWDADTFTPPADAISLASSDPYPNRAFLIGVSGDAVQFHAESIRGKAEVDTIAGQLERTLGPVPPR
jgi:GMP synthase-like glutamine amidotransferase